MRSSSPKPRRGETTSADRARLAEDRRHRAQEELLEVRPKPSAPFLILEVSNPIRRTRYRVYAPEYPDLRTMACECTDFGHRGLGTCKHIEAARAWIPTRPASELREHRSSASGAIDRAWRSIDQQMSRLSRLDAGPSLRWRRPGAVLFELGSWGF